MNIMIPMVLPSGREILIPALDNSTDADMTVDAAGGESAFEDVSFHFEFKDIVDAATEIGVMFKNAFEKILPRRASVELTLGIDARSGRLTAFFVDTGATGSIRILLEWEKVEGKPK